MEGALTATLRAAGRSVLPCVAQAGFEPAFSGESVRRDRPYFPTAHRKYTTPAPSCAQGSPDYGFEGNGYGRASEDFNHVFKEGLCFVGVHRSHLVLAGFGSAQLDVEHSTVLVYVR